MTKTISNLVFKKTSDCWISEKQYEGQLVFEVYTEEINVDLIEKILKRMDTDIKRILDEAPSVLIPLANCYLSGSYNAIRLYCCGITIGLNQDFDFMDFRIYFHLSADDNFSDFANWMIDVKDFLIVGCRREQC